MNLNIIHYIHISSSFEERCWKRPSQPSMASAPRKRKRITPTLVAVDAADDTSAPDAVDAPVAAAAAGVVVEELEVVAKAVKQLQPLKVGG